MKPFENVSRFYGAWWDPKGGNDPYHCTLEVQPARSVLSSTVEDLPDEILQSNTIHGNANGNLRVSLYNLGRDGEDVISQFGVYGFQHVDLLGTPFSKASVCLNGLDLWYSFSGFKGIPDSKEVLRYEGESVCMDLSCRSPESCAFDLPGGSRLLIDHAGTLDWHSKYHGMSVRFHTIMQWEAGSSFGPRSFLEFLYDARTLIEFFNRDHVDLNFASLELANGNDKKEDDKKGVKYITPSVEPRNRSRLGLYSFSLCSYWQVRDSFPGVVAAWWARRRALTPILKNLTLPATAPDLDSRDLFLAVARAAEAAHEQIFKDRDICGESDAVVYRNAIKTFLKDSFQGSDDDPFRSDTRKQKLVRAAIGKGLVRLHKPSLRDRLVDLIAHAGALADFEWIRDVEEFCKRVVFCRNHLTHLGSEATQVSRSEVRVLTEYLCLITSLPVLHFLGVSEVEIRSMPERGWLFLMKCNPYRYDSEHSPELNWLF